MAASVNDPITFLSLERHLRPGYFENPQDRQIMDTMITLNEDGVIPSFEVLLLELRRLKNISAIQRLKVLRLVKVSENEHSYIEHTVTEFARRQEIIKAIRESVDLIRNDEFDEIERKFRQAFQLGRERESLGTFFFEDVVERYKEESTKASAIRTLMVELDQHLEGGGIGRGDLGVVIAPPGRGKTFALIYLAKAAVIQRKHVIFYEFEMPENKIAKRLDASFSNVLIRELTDKRMDVITRINELGKIYQNSLVIKSFPISSQSAADLQEHIDQLRREGFEPDMICIDYADRMVSETMKADSRYYELRDVYVELKRLAQERNVAVWTASQTNRAALNKELVSIDDFSESFEKAMLADLIISLCQTQKEKQEERMRLFVAKNRNDISEVVVPIMTNFRKGTFYKIMPSEEESLEHLQRFAGKSSSEEPIFQDRKQRNKNRSSRVWRSKR
jgi:replicative DNA helicase